MNLQEHIRKEMPRVLGLLVRIDRNAEQGKWQEAIDACTEVLIAIGTIESDLVLAREASTLTQKPSTGGTVSPSQDLRDTEGDIEY